MKTRKAVKQKSDTNIFIPDDILLLILLRLPAKSLFRFKCVSKQWYFLIQDQKFIDSHLDQTKKTGIRFTQVLDAKRKCYRFYSIDRHGLATEVYSRFVPDEFECYIDISSCHGLLCLIDMERYVILLYNPVAQETKVLPRPLCCRDKSIHVLGFGFDTFSRKYKVVCWSEGSCSEIEILTLGVKSESWRKITCRKGILGAINCFNKSVYANGALNWISDVSNIIISFRLTDEKFVWIYCPTEADNYHSKLFESGDHLCILDSDLDLNQVNLWVLMDYEKHTWVKTRIQLPFPKDHIRWQSIVAIGDHEFLLHSQYNGYYVCRYSEQGNLTKFLIVRRILSGVVPIHNNVERLFSFRSNLVKSFQCDKFPIAPSKKNGSSIVKHSVHRRQQQLKLIDDCGIKSKLSKAPNKFFKETDLFAVKTATRQSKRVRRAPDRLDL
ncbi:F-box domain containing protein [Thalictrum thalictroides]|uniref:F-box domain containing protein n=1 Tax=Thalictrum thalictroides TaxID=46969 RepID=A0A7J6WGB2_THATH|nr:F-box domain containing protein [Thalictrum thalictroides]